MDSGKPELVPSSLAFSSNPCGFSKAIEKLLLSHLNYTLIIEAEFKVPSGQLRV